MLSEIGEDLRWILERELFLTKENNKHNRSQEVIDSYIKVLEEEWYSMCKPVKPIRKKLFGIF